MSSKQLTFTIVADENILANTHIDPGQVSQKIPLLTTRVETLAADKHVIVKLPLVPFFAFDSWRLHESEIQVQSNQRFFFLAASRHVFAASRLRLIR